jgi:hypothetical protein
MNKTASGDFYFNLKASNIGSVNIKDIKINDKSYKDFNPNTMVYIFYSNRKMEIFNKEESELPLIKPGDYIIIIIGIKIPYNPKLEGEKISVGILTSRGQYDITLILTFKEYA